MDGPQLTIAVLEGPFSGQYSLPAPAAIATPMLHPTFESGSPDRPNWWPTSNRLDVGGLEIQCRACCR